MDLHKTTRKRFYYIPSVHTTICLSYREKIESTMNPNDSNPVQQCINRFCAKNLDSRIHKKASYAESMHLCNGCESEYFYFPWHLFILPFSTYASHVSSFIKLRETMNRRNTILAYFIILERNITKTLFACSCIVLATDINCDRSIDLIILINN